MNSGSKHLSAVQGGPAWLDGAPSAGATDVGPPVEHLLQFRQSVVAGPDGNGVLSAAFPTTMDGSEVRYVLRVDRAAADAGLVETLEVRLNGDVVVQSDDFSGPVRVRVSLNAPDGDANSIVVTAGGAPGAAARVSLLAVRPAAVPFGGRSILPWAVIGAQTGTALTVHNVGPTRLLFHLLLFDPGGDLAGRSGPRAIAPRATENLDLSQIVESSRLGWSRGAVHVRWAAPGFTRVSTVATQTDRVADTAGVLQVVRVRELALDDYEPVPVNRADLQGIAGD